MQTFKSKSKTEKSEQILKAYDIKFSVMYLKKLVDEANEMNELKAAQQYKRDKAMELIPDDIRKTFKKIEGDKVIKTEIIIKNYLKSTDFYEKEYEPVVDFSKQQIFNQSENIRGVDIDYNYLNMGKPLPFFISNKDIDITESIENDVKLVLDHTILAKSFLPQ